MMSPHRDGISRLSHAFCAVSAGGGAAAASSRTKTARTRAPCEPKRQALELKRVGALARRDGQHGAQLRGQRGHARAGGDAPHRSSWLVAIAVASIGVQADSSRNVWSRSLMHGCTSKFVLAVAGRSSAAAPTRSYRGIILSLRPRVETTSARQCAPPPSTTALAPTAPISGPAGGAGLLDQCGRGQRASGL